MKPRIFDEALNRAYELEPEHMNTALHIAFYGSRVRGFPGSDSDWDLAIFNTTDDPAVDRRIVHAADGLDLLFINWARTKRPEWSRREIAAATNEGRWVLGGTHFDIDWEGMARDKRMRTHLLISTLKTHRISGLEEKHKNIYYLRLRRFMVRTMLMPIQKYIPCTPEVDMVWQSMETYPKAKMVREYGLKPAESIWNGIMHT